jgi:DNA-binding GntR family transcriptional regulator
MSILQEIAAVPDLTEQVYSRLLNAICAGELAPGIRITQEELAASLSVSRQPVLQALRLLKRDGVLIDAGRRGLAVAPLEPALIGQIYEVRAVLDGLAARQAAAAGARLDTRVIDRGRQAARSGRVAAMIEADAAFHHLVYGASGNPLIAESTRPHWLHIQRAMGATVQVTDARERVWDEHQAILDAINAGDAARAERLAREHCVAAGRFLSARIAEARAGESPTRSSPVKEAG